jgi:hypothetical protein
VTTRVETLKHRDPDALFRGLPLQRSILDNVSAGKRLSEFDSPKSTGTIRDIEWGKMTQKAQFAEFACNRLADRHWIDWCLAD